MIRRSGKLVQNLIRIYHAVLKLIIFEQLPGVLRKTDAIHDITTDPNVTSFLYPQVIFVL